MSRGAGTFLYVGDQPIKINIVVQVGGTNTYEVPRDFKVGGGYPPVTPVAASILMIHPW